MNNKKLRDGIAEVIAVVIVTAYTRGTLDGPVVTNSREDYKAADEIMALLKAPAPAPDKLKETNL